MNARMIAAAHQTMNQIASTVSATRPTMTHPTTQIAPARRDPYGGRGETATFS